MKEALVSKGPKVAIVDVPVPEPGDDQVLIRVVVSGSNPKDWKLPERLGGATNQGDDIAGVVAKVGKNVTEFHPGDRVGAFHEIAAPHGSYAEYAVAWQHTTLHVPAAASFESVAALPLAAATAAVGLYHDLGLPPPWAPTPKPTPLIVYGGATAVGAYAIQLARRSNLHPIIAVAGRSAPFVESLLDASRGDRVVDYRGGDDEAVVARLQAAVGDLAVLHAFDAVSEHNSSYHLSRVLPPGATVSHVLGWPADDDRIRKDLVHVATGVGRVHKDLQDFGFVVFRYLGRALQQGWLQAHPHEVVPGGLAGIEGALTKLKNGDAHAVKYLFRIADTEGVDKERL